EKGEPGQNGRALGRIENDRATGHTAGVFDVTLAVEHQNRRIRNSPGEVPKRYAARRAGRQSLDRLGQTGRDAAGTPADRSQDAAAAGSVSRGRPRRALDDPDSTKGEPACGATTGTPVLAGCRLVLQRS